MLIQTDKTDRLSKNLENVNKPVFQPWNKRIRNYTAKFLVQLIYALVYVCNNFKFSFRLT